MARGLAVARAEGDGRARGRHREAARRRLRRRAERAARGEQAAHLGRACRGRPAAEPGARHGQGQRDRARSGGGHRVVHGELGEPERIADLAAAEGGAEPVPPAVVREAPHGELVGGAGGVGNGQRDGDGREGGHRRPGPPGGPARPSAALSVMTAGVPASMVPRRQARGRSRGRGSRRAAAPGRRAAARRQAPASHRWRGPERAAHRGGRGRHRAGARRRLRAWPWSRLVRQRLARSTRTSAPAVNRLVGRGPGPARVLRERERPGGDRHDEQQRGAALAQRLAAELPGGQRAGQPAAARRPAGRRPARRRAAAAA